MGVGRVHFLTPCPAHCFFLFKGAEVQILVAARWAPLPDPRFRGVPEETTQLLLLLMNPKGLKGDSRGPTDTAFSSRSGLF